MSAVVLDDSLAFTVEEYDELPETLGGFHDDRRMQSSMIINGLPQALLHDEAYENIKRNLNIQSCSWLGALQI